MSTMELHCHTTLSDGTDSTETLVQKAIFEWLDLVAVTDHDRINFEAQQALTQAGILSPLSVEISAKDYQNDHSLHILYYTQKVSTRLLEILAGVVTSRREKIQKQCEKLASNGFDISYETLINYAQSRNIVQDNINNGTLAFYLLEGDYNRQRACELSGKTITHIQQIIDAFLKETSDYPEIGWVKIHDYEPSIETITQIAREDGGLLSVAHPMFSYERRGGIPAFEKAFERLNTLGIGAIEYNALATPEWEVSMRKMALRTDAILTFWSDYHGDANGRHGIFGNIHPNAQDIIPEHKKRFCEKVFG